MASGDNGPVKRAVVVLLFAVAACGGSPKTVATGRPSASPTPSPVTSTSPAPTAPPPAAKPSIPAVRPAVAPAAQRATAVVPTVQVRSAPAGPVRWTLKNPARFGVALTFLVTAVRDGWVQVLVPVRPNGARGWVRAADVRVENVTWRLEVRLAAHRLQIYHDGVSQRTVPVAVGRGSAPTPGGTYFVTALLRAPNPRGPFGPYAYALSGFSPVLTSFGGGDGQLALHGTNDPSSIGHDVSHGCIRLHNSDLGYLVGRLPLGTPVHVSA